MAQFWCAELRADKSTPFVPPPEASTRLHVSQATLVPDAAPDGQRVAVKCKVDEQEAFLCSLRAGSSESMRLDLIFDGYTEFELVGPKGARVHLAGYLVEDEGPEGGESDEELPGDMSEEDMRRLLLDQLIASGRIPDDLDDSEDESEGSEESEEEKEEEGVPAGGRRSSVIIEEVTDQPQASGRKAAAEGPESAAKPAAKAKAAAAAAVKAAAAAEVAAAIADGSEELDEEDEEEESSDEEMEAAELAEAAAVKAAAAKEPKRKAPEKQPQAASKKAKTEAAQPAKPAAAKQAAAKAGAKAEAKGEPAAAAAQAATPGGKKAVRRFPNGFAIETLALGAPSGKLAKAGKRVAMRYVGKLEKGGKVFDQTRGSKTFGFRLGVGEVIKGWDQGVVGMRVGDKRRLTVPPQMAYGAEGVKGVIPGNATLVFDVELVDVKG